MPSILLPSPSKEEFGCGSTEVSSRAMEWSRNEETNPKKKVDSPKRTTGGTWGRKGWGVKNWKDRKGNKGSYWVLWDLVNNCSREVLGNFAAYVVFYFLLHHSPEEGLLVEVSVTSPANPSSHICACLGYATGQLHKATASMLRAIW